MIETRHAIMRTRKPASDNCNKKYVSHVFADITAGCDSITFKEIPSDPLTWFTWDINNADAILTLGTCVDFDVAEWNCTNDGALSFVFSLTEDCCIPRCDTYRATNTNIGSETILYTDCDGNNQAPKVFPGIPFDFCARKGTVVAPTGVNIDFITTPCSL